MVAAALFAGALAMYVQTLAPGLLTDLGDPGDLQAAAVSLGVPHPTGYPLFVIAGWLWTHLFPFGSMAFRLNLLVAAFGALAVALTFLLALKITGRTLPSLAGAVLFGSGYTFWTQTTISEVYTLNAAFVAAVLLLLVTWGQRAKGWAALGGAAVADGGTLIWAAFVYGLSLAHHRTMILLLPAIAAYVWMVDRRVYADRGFLLRLVAATMPGALLYLFVFWRLLPQGYSPTEVLWGTILGGSFAGSLGQAPDWQRIFWELPAAQVGALGFVVAVAGIAVLVARRASRPQAVLLAGTYLGISLFCLIYRIPEIDPFLIPAFLSICVAISGLALTFARFGDRARLLLETALLMAAFVNASNVLVVADYWSEERGQSEAAARQALAAGLEQGAAVESDWNTGAALRYLQAAEGLRPDLEVLPVRLYSEREYRRLCAILESGRPAYLLAGVELSRLCAAAQWQAASSLPGVTRLSAATFQERGRAVSGALSVDAAGVGSDGTLTLFWRAKQPVPGDYAVVLDYYDAAGRLVAQDDKDPYQEAPWGFRSSRWVGAAVVSDLFRSLPADAAYVRVWLAAGTGRQGATYGRPVTVQIRPAAAPILSTGPGWQFGDEIVLAGVTASGTSTIEVAMDWLPLRAPARDYTVFLHLLDASGGMVGQGDRPPVDSLYPTSDWRPGDRIRDTYRVEVSARPVEMRLGLYDRSTMQRLPLAGGGDFVSVHLSMP